MSDLSGLAKQFGGVAHFSKLCAKYFIALVNYCTPDWIKMTNSEAEDFLLKLSEVRWNMGLKNITELTNSIGRPQENFKCIHVAGTNGKGSTCAALEAIFLSAGYKTGVFTSPHLIDVTERVRINGKAVARDAFDRVLLTIKPRVEAAGCTYFEAVTAVAFDLFSAENVDIAIIETGLGGRLDATNIITPILSIITDIAIDHEDYLGTTLTQIAQEKAGIIKAEGLCLSLSDHPEVAEVIRNVSASLQTQLFQLSRICEIKSSSLSHDFSSLSLEVLGRRFIDLRSSLLGRAQVRNSALAVAASCILHSAGEFHIEDSAIYRGLAQTTWPARMQILSTRPHVVLDVAHNSQSVQMLMEDLRTLFEFDKLLVVVGLLRDKNYVQVAQIVADKADKIFTVTPDSDRALDGNILKQVFNQQGVPAEQLEKLERCFEKKVCGQAEVNDLVCVLGSHYLAGRVLRFYGEKYPKNA